jgi:hypothetical protein
MLNVNELKRGQEQFETYFSPTRHKELIHYNYRDYNGELFSCSGETLEECRRICKKHMGG